MLVSVVSRKVNLIRVTAGRAFHYRCESQPEQKRDERDEADDSDNPQSNRANTFPSVLRFIHGWLSSWMVWRLREGRRICFLRFVLFLFERPKAQHHREANKHNDGDERPSENQDSLSLLWSFFFHGSNLFPTTPEQKPTRERDASGQRAGDDCPTAHAGLNEENQCCARSGNLQLPQNQPHNGPTALLFRLDRRFGSHRHVVNLLSEAATAHRDGRSIPPRLPTPTARQEQERREPSTSALCDLTETLV